MWKGREKSWKLKSLRLVFSLSFIPVSLYILYQVWKKQDGHPGLWLVETFSTSPLKLLNGIQRNLTASNFLNARPLPSLCFSGRFEKQDGHPSLWLAETFWTSCLKLLNRIWQNLTENKILTSSTKVCVFLADQNTKMTVPASYWLRAFLLLLSLSLWKSLVNYAGTMRA